MSDWAPKVFWSEVSTAETDGFFEVLLDSRRIKTPAKAALRLPTQQLADDVASEWRAQTDKVDPAKMPMTRMANSSIDKVTPQLEAVQDAVADYSGTDLICYRATHPQELIDRQNAGWDPLLDWVEHAFSAKLEKTSGLMPIAQNPKDLALLKAQIRDFRWQGSMIWSVFQDLL
jgi:chaperone required for assembly of F1-ATPase